MYNVLSLSGLRGKVLHLIVFGYLTGYSHCYIMLLFLEGKVLQHRRKEHIAEW